MGICECILKFGESLTGTKLQPNAQGGITLLFDEQWWVQIYEHLGRIYFDIPIDTALTTLERQYFRFDELGLRMVNRDEQQYLQGSLAISDVTNANNLLYSAINAALSVCEQLPASHEPFPSSSSQWTLPSGVVRP